MTNATAPDLSRIRFALHGGAGDIADNTPDQPEHRAVLRRIAEAAIQCLREGATAVESVTRAVELLEECPLFNAGVGAVLNRDGQPELDAAIMRGEDRGCGAVTCVSHVRRPIRLARAVMEQTPHVLFASVGAEQLAKSLGLELVEPAFFITRERIAQLELAQRSGAIVLDHDTAFDHAEQSSNAIDGAGFGTVGAVARDASGHLAAATSTGGLTNKLPGRIGDTPLVGIGTFADDYSCAVSCTGTGEAFIKTGFGLMLHARTAWSGRSLEAACSEALDEVMYFGGRGGCIAIDREGDVQLRFNSNAMYRAWAGADGTVRVAIRLSDAD